MVMNMDDPISKFINSVPFFKEFSDHEKNKMINRTKCFVKFSKDDVVFLQGDPGDSLYLILHGTVGLFRLGTINIVAEDKISLQKEVEKLVKDNTSGSIFGEIAMLTTNKRNVTARITSPSAVLMKINKQLMEGLNPAAQIKFHKQLLLSLANHLSAMNSQFVDLEHKYDTLVAKQLNPIVA